MNSRERLTPRGRHQAVGYAVGNLLHLQTGGSSPPGDAAYCSANADKLPVLEVLAPNAQVQPHVGCNVTLGAGRFGTGYGASEM
jgi:hypothetical protein